MSFQGFLLSLIFALGFAFLLILLSQRFLRGLFRLRLHLGLFFLPFLHQRKLRFRQQRLWFFLWLRELHLGWYFSPWGRCRLWCLLNSGFIHHGGFHDLRLLRLRHRLDFTESIKQHSQQQAMDQDGEDQGTSLALEVATFHSS